MLHMIELDSTGDTKHVWDTSNPTEVQQAKELFNLYRERNFATFRVQENGEPGVPVEEFDVNLGCILMIPLMAGG